MPSGPALFDDEGDPRPERDRTGPSAPRTPDDRDTADAPAAGGRRPNYLFRRAVVVGGVVAVIATAAIIVGGLIGTGGTTTSSGAVSVEWNRIVVIDPRVGRVLVDDERGDELQRIDTELRTVTDSAVVDRTALLVSADSAAVVDLAEGTVTAIEMASDGIARPSGSALTMIATDGTRSSGLLVHGPTGDVVDTAEFAPIPGARYEFSASRSTTSGRSVLVTDSGNFQSVLFSFDRTDPSFFPGLALAIDDDVVVTAQNVGTDATISVFDHDREQLASGRTPSVRAAMVSGDTIVLVTVDGELIEMSASSGDTDTVGQLDVGTVQSGAVWTSGDRLVVVGDGGTAIVGEGGEVVASVTSAAPIDQASLLRATCLVVTDAAANLTIVDTGDGSIVAESEPADDVVASSDGCTVVTGSDDRYELLSVDGAEAVEPDGDVIALTPDASAIVVETERRVVLTPITDALDNAAEPETTTPDDESTDSVDLGPAGRVISFTEL